MTDKPLSEEVEVSFDHIDQRYAYGLDDAGLAGLARSQAVTLAAYCAERVPLTPSQTLQRFAEIYPTLDAASARLITQARRSIPSEEGVQKVVERLKARAAKARKFAAHAEANRDGWFATMPPEISQDELQFADDLDALLSPSEEGAPHGIRFATPDVWREALEAIAKTTVSPACARIAKAALAAGGEDQ